MQIYFRYDKKQLNSIRWALNLAVTSRSFKMYKSPLTSKLNTQIEVMHLQRNVIIFLKELISTLIKITILG